MSDAVLVLNAGSSSIKFGLFDIGAAEPQLLCKGLLDEQEKAPRLLVNDASGKALFEKRSRASGDHKDLYVDIFAWIEDYLGVDRLAAVGHRIVHGGRDLFQPVVATEEIMAALEALTPLAPLHQPRCLAPIRAIQSVQRTSRRSPASTLDSTVSWRRRSTALRSHAAMKSAACDAMAFTACPSNISQRAWLRFRRHLRRSAS
jgi:acetate kinase